MENKSPAKRGLKTDNKGTKRDGGNALRAADLSPICCASATLSIFHRPRPNQPEAERTLAFAHGLRERGKQQWSWASLPVSYRLILNSSNRLVCRIASAGTAVHGSIQLNGNSIGIRKRLECTKVSYVNFARSTEGKTYRDR